MAAPSGDGRSTATVVVDRTGSVRVRPTDGLRGTGRLVDYLRAAARQTPVPSLRFVWLSEDGPREAAGAGPRRVDIAPGRSPMSCVAEVTPLIRAETGELTERELQVLTLLAGGLTNPGIAERLGVSRRTVATHIERLLLKLEVTSRAAAAALAVDRSLLALPLPPGGTAGFAPVGLLALEDAVRRAGPAPEPAGRPRRRTPARRPLVIGAVYPSNPEWSADGLEMERGALLAVEELNRRGGVAGRRVEHVAVRADLTAAGAVASALRTLVDADVEPHLAGGPAGGGLGRGVPGPAPLHLGHGRGAGRRRTRPVRQRVPGLRPRVDLRLRLRPVGDPAPRHRGLAADVAAAAGRRHGRAGSHHVPGGGRRNRGTARLAGERRADRAAPTGLVPRPAAGRGDRAGRGDARLLRPRTAGRRRPPPGPGAHGRPAVRAVLPLRVLLPGRRGPRRRGAPVGDGDRRVPRPVRPRVRRAVPRQVRHGAGDVQLRHPLRHGPAALLGVEPVPLAARLPRGQRRTARRGPPWRERRLPPRQREPDRAGLPRRDGRRLDLPGAPGVPGAGRRPPDHRAGRLRRRRLPGAGPPLTHPPAGHEGLGAVVPVGERNRRELVAMGMQVLALLPEAPTPVATQPAVLDTFLARLRDG